MAADSHSTRRSIALSVSRSGDAGGGDGCVVVGEPLKGCDLPTPDRAERRDRHRPADAARASARVPRSLGGHLVAEGLDTPDLELEHAVDVARVPSPGKLADDVGVPHSEGAWTVHPSSKLVPGRARRSSAPARLVRGARAVSLKAASSRI